MSYLLLLLIFWKPLYFTFMYFYKKRDEEYSTKLRDWFYNLMDLVKP